MPVVAIDESFGTDLLPDERCRLRVARNQVRPFSSGEQQVSSVGRNAAIHHVARSMERLAARRNRHVVTVDGRKNEEHPQTLRLRRFAFSSTENWRKFQLSGISEQFKSMAHGN